jgi:hypothetical protein
MKLCKHCQKGLIQTKGKREKEFCNNTCRSNFWFKNKRENKKEVKVVNLNNPTVVNPVTNQKDTTNYSIDTTPKEKTMWDDAAKQSIKEEISKITSENMPPHITSALGKRIWINEQNKKIELLKQQLK